MAHQLIDKSHVEGQNNKEFSQLVTALHGTP